MDDFNKKLEAQRLMLGGMSLTDIKKKYPEIGTRSLSIWRQELISDKRHMELDKIANIDPDTIERLALVIEDKFPATASKLHSVVTGLDSLQRLEPKVHGALNKIVQVAELALDKALEEGAEPMKLSDLKGYADIITKMHTSLFNRPNAVVNIQNNSNNPVIQSAVTEKLNGLMRGLLPDEPAIEVEVTT